MPKQDENISHTLDLTGLFCPQVVLEVRKAMDALPLGKTLRVISTDPLSRIDIPLYVRRAGLELVEQSAKKDHTQFYFSLLKTELERTRPERDNSALREGENLFPIAAIRVSSGEALDDALLFVAERLKAQGVRLAGAVQRMRPAPRGHRCDADLLLLANGESVFLPEERGEGAKGCRLNIPAFEAATELVRLHVAENPALLIINRFGKREALGAGFRPAIAEAFERAIPVLIGVPERNWQAFSEYIGGGVTLLPAEAEVILAWCRSIMAVSRLREQP